MKTQAYYGRSVVEHQDYAVPIKYLNLGGGSNLWMSHGVKPYIFGLTDLNDAVERDSSTDVVMRVEATFATFPSQFVETEPETSEEFIEKHKLAVDVERISLLAKEMLGAATTTSRRLRKSQETGDLQLVVEVHYQPEGITRDNLRDFMRAYSAELPAETQQKVTLLRIPA